MQHIHSSSLNCCNHIERSLYSLAVLPFLAALSQFIVLFVICPKIPETLSSTQSHDLFSGGKHSFGHTSSVPKWHSPPCTISFAPHEYTKICNEKNYWKEITLVERHSSSGLKYTSVIRRERPGYLCCNQRRTTKQCLRICQHRFCG